jgi:hypothetical protein
MDQSEADEYLGPVKQSSSSCVNHTIEEGIYGSTYSVAHP